MVRSRGDLDLKLVDQWKSSGKLPRPKKILYVLAKIIDYHRLDEPDIEEVLVHVEVLEMIGETSVAK
jgi:hypothetical protein